MRIVVLTDSEWKHLNAPQLRNRDLAHKIMNAPRVEEAIEDVVEKMIEHWPMLAPEHAIKLTFITIETLAGNEGEMT